MASLDFSTQPQKVAPTRQWTNNSLHLFILSLIQSKLSPFDSLLCYAISMTKVTLNLPDKQTTAHSPPSPTIRPTIFRSRFVMLLKVHSSLDFISGAQNQYVSHFIFIIFSILSFLVPPFGRETIQAKQEIWFHNSTSFAFVSAAAFCVLELLARGGSKKINYNGITTWVSGRMNE